MDNITVNIANLPQINRPRSKFVFKDKLKTTFNLGELHILDWRICIPGDQFKITETKVIRTQPMVSAPMDDLVYDTYWFKQDIRDLWDNFPKFIGESNGKWRDFGAVQKIMPKISSGNTTGVELGSILDDLGCTIGAKNQLVNALPVRMYGNIVNHFFRSTVVEDELYVPTGDATQTYISKATVDPINGPANGQTYICNRNVDLLSLSSIEPQRGPEVTISTTSGEIPVYGNGKALGLYNGNDFTNPYTGSDGLAMNTNKTATFPNDIGSSRDNLQTLTNLKYIGVPSKTTLDAASKSLDSTGLVAGIGATSIITINELRNAFAIQRYYEQLSLFGNRYNEIVQSLFNVQTKDRYLHRPEFIGGRSLPIQIYSNVQSSETSTTSPQGNVVGYSVTGDESYILETGIDDYSLLMCVGVARIKQHTYSQGLDRDLLINTFEDIFNPLFDELGDDKIYNAEIYAQPGVVNPLTGKLYDEEVFGYNERWYNYRYGKNHVTGMFRPNITTPLPWTFTDNYVSMPHLDRAWMKEDKALLDRVLAVNSSVADQMFMDYSANIEALRPMKAHSIPGAIIR